jgi:hypothetical protein
MSRLRGRRWTYRALAVVAGLALAVLTVDTQRGSGSATPPPVPTSGSDSARTAAAQAPQLATIPVAGWIIDAAGRPIAGVHVTTRDAAGVRSPVLADSEADGGFRIEPPTADLDLLLDAPHVFPAELRWRAGEPPPRIMLARRARIATRVIANGAPVIGAEVTISDGSRPALATAVTGPDGIATFDDLLPGPYELWARRDAMVSPLVRIAEIEAEPDRAIELALAAAGTVRGRVVADGALPPGSAVRIVPMDLDHVARTTGVDDRGGFAIAGVPRGRWRVEVDAPGFVHPADRIVEVVDAGLDLELVLRRAGIVTGTVVDVTGAPVVNATIVLRQRGAKTPRVEDRRTLTASERLRWIHPLAGARQMPIRDTRRFGASRPGMRPAECGQGHCGNDLGTERGAVVHAAADGEIVAAFTEIRREAGRYVAVEHGDGVRTYYMHLDELRADLELGQHVRAGDALGTLGSTGFTRSNPHLHFAISQERDGRTWYIDPEPILQHAVVLPAPRALDRSDVDTSVVVATVRWGELAVIVPAPAQVDDLATDGFGKFRLDGIAPGTYVATAFDTRLAPGVSAPFTVQTAAETSGIVITLRPGVIVSGRVLGRDGPVAGARIVAGEGFGESAHKVATAYTDHTGAYVLRSLAGKLTLSVSAAGYGELERSIALDPVGPDRRREDFELTTETARLRGVVLGPDGVASGVEVRIVEGPTRRRRAVTDAHGEFALEQVATGAYVVELASAEYPTVRAQVRAEEWKELRLEQGGAIRLELLDAHTGMPLAGIRVDAAGPGSRAVKRTTDARGVVELRGLTPGAWTVRARAAGYVAADRSIAVKPSRIAIEARLELARGATLAGVVRDRYGQRVAGARVWLGSVSTTTDADGNFRLTDVPTGAGRLEAEREAASGGVPVNLAPGDELVTLTIDLAE